ncbi:hypothetical protein GCM10010094_30910 [Streptomyces flaveus]|uniref:Uncharacterized protein n=1 Tax=Streptomyces flaveus TaxID=66370 RepID=A0A917VDQ4_9ACTN|nr:hypothetical protein GCM10010094_30910 [Streptomyces flaveus]
MYSVIVVPPSCGGVDGQLRIATGKRLRSTWPTVSRSAVYWNIDYLAVKLRLRPGPDTADPGGPRLNGKKESLVSLALRFDLVREDDLGALAPASAAPSQVTR